jgi:tol-pal system protein YbgF
VRTRDDGARAGKEDGRPSVLDPDAKRAYDQALSDVNARRYDRAMEGLTAFLARYPDHPYAENATYWRGEVYFARGEYLRAAEQFEAVLSKYNGNKAPDALLKLGSCHERLGATDRAKEYWDRLRRDHPRSDAAKRVPLADAKGPKETR